MCMDVIFNVTSFITITVGILMDTEYILTRLSEHPQTVGDLLILNVLKDFHRRLNEIENQYEDGCQYRQEQSE